MRLRSLMLGLAAAGVVVLAVLLIGSGSSGYKVRMSLTDADGLLSGSRVEIGGIGVGTVTSLKITSKDHALVTFTVNSQDAPIGTNASAVVRPADLLGEKYVDLSVGNRSSAAPSGFTIPTSHTQVATDFDQVVDVLAPTERDRLAILIHETGVALFGRGADLQQLLQSLPPSLSDARALISQVTASNTQLEGLIGHADGVVSTLTANQNALTHFVATGAGALSATAAHAADLAQSIAETPGLLTQLDTTLKGLDVAGANLRPAARGLEKTAPALTETLNELPGFTTAARPTLNEVRSISPELVSLGKQSAPVIARLEPTLQKLESLATAATPVTTSLDSGIDNLLGTLQNWPRAIQTADGLSHEFRLSVEVTPNLVNDLLPYITGSLASAAKPSKTPSQSTTPSGSRGSTASSLSQSLASTTSNLGAGVSGTVSKVLNGVSGTLNGVTSQLGVTTTTQSSSTTTGSSSLQNLLGYLMGGGK